MSDFLSSDSEEFDRQILDWSGGINKPRTLLSGTWRKWINEECEDTAWQCLAAWDNGDGLIAFTMQDPEGWEAVHAVEKVTVDRVHAARTFAAIDYLYRNPRQKLTKAGINIVPEGFANPSLYKELFCMGFEGDALIAEYESLGGEYE
jgi:hypothetical protein